MTFLAFPPSAEDLKTVTQSAASGDTITPLAAGNYQIVLVDTNAATTRTENIDGTDIDFVEVTLSNSTEVGQIVKVGRNGTEHLWVNATITGDTVPLGYAIGGDAETIRVVEFICNTVGTWEAVSTDGAKGDKGDAGTLGTIEAAGFY